MPFIDVKTNVELTSEKKEELKAELGKAITAIPGKSESWLMVKIEDKADMWFKGDDSPCVMFDTSIFGLASNSAYDDLTARLCKLANDILGVSPSRSYVKYNEIDHWGWNNMNF